MTYVEAMSEIQKSSIEALKVVQSTQIASLQATRDLTAALIITPPLALFGVPPLITAMANLTRSVAFQLLEGQIACAKSVTETLVAPMRALSPAPPQALALTGETTLEVLPAITATLVTVPRKTVVDVEPIDEAILVEATQAADVSEVSAQRTNAAPAAVETAEEPAVELAARHAEVAASPAALEVADAPLEVADDAPLEAAALTTELVRPPAIEVEPPVAADEQIGTADVLAKTLPPPNLAAPGPAAGAPSKATAAAKKKKAAEKPASPSAGARSKRRPSK